MKKIILATLIFSSVRVFAAKDFGLGVILGSPTGISGKLGMSEDHAIDAAIAWDLNGDDEFHIHGDFLWLKNKGIHLDNVFIDWYFGVGGRMVLIDHDHHRHHDHDDFLLGVRAPIGVSYTFPNPKIELFAELAAVLNLIESTDVDLEGGLGARYHF